MFCTISNWALPVFALPSHRSSEISYFCEFGEASAYVISDKALGFDYRKLAREVKEKVPTLQHVIVVGEEEEFVNINDLYMDPSHYQKFSQVMLHFSNYQEAQQVFLN